MGNFLGCCNSNENSSKQEEENSSLVKKGLLKNQKVVPNQPNLIDNKIHKVFKEEVDEDRTPRQKSSKIVVTFQQSPTKSQHDKPMEMEGVPSPSGKKLVYGSKRKKKRNNDNEKPQPLIRGML